MRLLKFRSLTIRFLSCACSFCWSVAAILQTVSSMKLCRALCPCSDLAMVCQFNSQMELINLPLIKSALPVSIPGFTLSNLNITGHIFLTNISSVTLSAVGCTGCAHHNGPFLKRTNHELHTAEFLHDSSGMLRHRHQTRPGIPGEYESVPIR